jgi:hypothetical protein
VAARKNRLKKQKDHRDAPRFTTDDIVRAIEAVQQTGLTVHAVEITTNGSIHINTTSPFKRAGASKPKPSTEVPLDAVQPDKKRA